MKKILRWALRKAKRWLAEEPTVEEEALPPFDNNPQWLRPAFQRINRACQRPSYVWGVLQGVALAKVLGYPRVSVAEFGVAGGAGLLALERIADLVENMVGVEIEVYGFDTGKGLPPPTDYRDLPYLCEEGYFPMDVDELRRRLTRAQLKLGLIDTTVPAFLRSSFAPFAFISIDVDLYTSTRQALRVLEAPTDRLLPRISYYFDDIIGYGCNDYTGERLAIHEFNAEHPLRKLAPEYGVKFAVPPQNRHDQWVDMIYLAHIFDHPSYGALAQIAGGNRLDIEGNWGYKV